MSFVNEKEKNSTNLKVFFEDTRYYTAEDIEILYCYHYKINNKTRVKLKKEEKDFFDRVCYLIKYNYCNAHFKNLDFIYELFDRVMEIGDGVVARKLIIASSECNIYLSEELLKQLIITFEESVHGEILEYSNEQLKKNVFDHLEIIHTDIAMSHDLFAKGLEVFDECVSEYAQNLDGELSLIFEKFIKDSSVHENVRLMQFLQFVEKYNVIGEFDLEILGLEEAVFNYAKKPEEIELYLKLVTPYEESHVDLFKRRLKNSDDIRHKVLYVDTFIKLGNINELSDREYIKRLIKIIYEKDLTEYYKWAKDYTSILVSFDEEWVLIGEDIVNEVTIEAFDDSKKRTLVNSILSKTNDSLKIYYLSGKLKGYDALEIYEKMIVDGKIDNMEICHKILSRIQNIYVESLERVNNYIATGEELMSSGIIEENEYLARISKIMKKYALLLEEYRIGVTERNNLTERVRIPVDSNNT